MGRKAISYEAFKAAWTDLEAQGKATIPNARSVVGGSNPTLMKYRDRLRAEQDESELAAFDLPATLKQVIHAFASERCKVVETQKADLLADIAEYQKALDENATETQEKAENWVKAAEGTRNGFCGLRRLYRLLRPALRMRRSAKTYCAVRSHNCGHSIMRRS